EGCPTRVLDEPGHVLGVLFFLGQIGQGDVSAFAGEGDRHGSADARVRTGDQGPAPLETTGAAIAVLTAIGVRDEFGVQARFGLVLFRWCDVGEAIDRVLECQLVTHLSPSSCNVGVLLDVRGGCRPRTPEAMTLLNDRVRRQGLRDRAKTGISRCASSSQRSSTTVSTTSRTTSRSSSTTTSRGSSTTTSPRTSCPSSTGCCRRTSAAPP